MYGWRSIIRKFVTRLFALFATIFAVPVLGGYFIDLAKERGLYGDLTAKSIIVIDALKSISTNPVFLGSFIFIIGLMIGLWADTVFRRREAVETLSRSGSDQAEHAATEESTDAKAIGKTGLYVGFIRVSASKMLSDHFIEIIIRGFNGSGKKFAIANVTGNIVCNLGNGSSKKHEHALPQPSFSSDVGPNSTIEDKQEFSFTLEQRIPADVAKQIRDALADNLYVHLHLDKLDINVFFGSDKNKSRRIPLWDGVTLRQSGTEIVSSRVVKATAIASEKSKVTGIASNT